METQTSTILSRFTTSTIDASALKGIDPEVITHAIDLGWIKFQGRKATITELGAAEQKRQA